MNKIDYFKIIHKYIKPDSKTYPRLIIHSTLVTQKALLIAKKQKLSKNSLNFIEEAAMLHDIGIVKVKDTDLDCSGHLPYICHIIEGAKILRKEGLPRHARVAETHTGVGIFREDIMENNLPLPEKNYIPETIEEKIISYSDLFFSKNSDEIWKEKSISKVKSQIVKHGERHLKVLEKWIEKFS